MTDWKEVENELKKFKEGEDYTVAENNTGTRIYIIKAREAKRKIRMTAFGWEGQLDGPVTSKDEDGNETTSWGGSFGVGDESEDKKTYYSYEQIDVVDGSESDIFKIVSGEDKIKQDEEEKQKREESKRKEKEFWKKQEEVLSDMKNTIEKNLEKAGQQNEKCASCGQKITNCRIVFSKNGKKEGPYCSGKCSETSSLKKETQSSSNSQQVVDNDSTSKLVSVIKGIAFFGLGVLPLTITAIIIYLLNKK